VTSTYRFAVGLSIIISFLTLSVYAQSAGPEVNHFASEGISFDYPAGYSVTDESTAEVQQFTLTQRGSSVQVVIVAKRGFIRRTELSAAIENFAEPLVKNLTIKVGQGKRTPVRTNIQTQVGQMEVEGLRLRASGGTRTGEVIWFRMHFRLIGLAFVRSDVDESVGSKLWQNIRSSLGVEAPVLAVTTTGVEPSGGQVVGGVMNGKALALPQPPYPTIARAAHASGTVTVQVIIDEQGDVTSAHAVSGHPLLQAVCVAAARQAKFSPTLLDGEPVKVTGVIQYNFVSQ
jgi:TonB family protein